MRPSGAWSKEEFAFAQELLRNGAFPSDVAFRLTRKFKIVRTAQAVRTHIHSGKLVGYGEESRQAREEKVIALRLLGVSQREIAQQMEMGFKRVRTLCREKLKDERGFKRKEAHAPLEEFSQIYCEDPVADIGVSLLDLQANQCRYPVARDPDDKSQRFCGECVEERPQIVNSHFTRRSYCPLHAAICYQREPILQAAE